MAMQERAVRTRSALVRAAARAFDRNGYEGTSLSQIRAAAEMSMGALTFHFATKGELADAVQDAGWLLTEARVRDGLSPDGDPVDGLVSLTLALAALMEEEPLVRSAARLTRERAGGRAWTSAWLPAAHELIDRARSAGVLPPVARPEVVADLVSHLIVGAEAQIRASAADAGRPAVDVGGQLARIWDLVLLPVRG